MTHATDDTDSPLAGLDLQVWRVPPPAAIDRDALLGRALSPSIAPPKTMRLRWILAAIVVLNAAIATLIGIITRPDPAPATVALPAGGTTDARVRELLQRLEQEQRALEQKLVELEELRALVVELSRKVERYESAPRMPDRPRVPDRPAPLRPLDAPLEAVPSDVPELDRIAISTTINPLKPQIAACGARSTMKGMIKVRARVSPDGTVASVTVDDASDPALGTCVANIIKNARFPRTAGGSFSYPFVF